MDCEGSNGYGMRDVGFTDIYSHYRTVPIKQKYSEIGESQVNNAIGIEPMRTLHKRGPSAPESNSSFRNIVDDQIVIKEKSSAKLSSHLTKLPQSFVVTRTSSQSLKRQISASQKVRSNNKGEGLAEDLLRVDSIPPGQQRKSSIAIKACQLLHKRKLTSSFKAALTKPLVWTPSFLIHSKNITNAENALKKIGSEVRIVSESTSKMPSRLNSARSKKKPESSYTLQ